MLGGGDDGMTPISYLEVAAEVDDGHAALAEHALDGIGTRECLGKPLP